MENEVMVNEEVIETATEEIVEAGSHNGLKIAAGVGIAGLAVGLTVKFVVIPTIKKIKAKKNQNNVDEAAEDLFETDDTNTEDDN